MPERSTSVDAKVPGGVASVRKEIKSTREFIDNFKGITKI